MARLGKETAKRSLMEYIDRLPAEAAIEVVNHPGAPGPPLPEGVGLRVKILVTEVQTVPEETVPVEIRTSGTPGKERSKSPAIRACSAEADASAAKAGSPAPSGRALKKKDKPDADVQGH